MDWFSGVVSEAAQILGKASAGVKIVVDQNNILEAMRIIESEAQHFRAQLSVRADSMRVHEMGSDPVSAEVARVLTARFVGDDDSYAKRCSDYAAMLEGLAQQLCESARVYGFTEEEVMARFNAAREEGYGRSLDLASSHDYGGLRAV